MNVDGSDPRRLTNTEAAEDHLAWSPDGNQILFDADYDGDGFYEIYTMKPDGTGVARLTANAANDQFADWSPDGALIAFSSDRNGNWDIFVMDADGANQHPLTSSPNWELFPAWSPDGSQIIFQTRRDGNFELYVMGVDGSQPRLLAASPANELWPSWGLAAPLLSLEKSNQELGMSHTYQAAIGDLDGDGDLDAFIVCHQFSLPSQIYLNDGSGLFTATGQDLGDARLSAADLNLLDVNGDGYVDAHVLYYSPSGLPDQVYLNDGQATFHDSGLALEEDFIAWGDINGDGDMDYFGKRWGQGYVAMLNDGAGQFTEYWQMADSRATVGDVALADFDADGDLDALVANGFREIGGFPSRYLVNDGSGKFTDSEQVLFETLGASLAVGDLDLDGDLDVFVANMDRPNQVWLYQDGQFINSGLQLGNASEMSGRATLADLDGDGGPDVIVGRFRGGAEVWFNLATINEK